MKIQMTVVAAVAVVKQMRNIAKKL